jgi:PIN domain nuclease of toxin-antitoxin system
MKLLLDTHVFLWFRNAPDKLPEHVLACYENIDNDIFLSMVSVWEMQIKNQLGKLELDLPLNELIEQQCLNNGLQILGIETSHIYTLQNLPPHHNDPFDRLIIAQAQFENLQLVSADAVFNRYDVDVMWQPAGVQ